MGEPGVRLGMRASAQGVALALLSLSCGAEPEAAPLTAPAESATLGSTIDGSPSSALRVTVPRSLADGVELTNPRFGASVRMRFVGAGEVVGRRHGEGTLFPNALGAGFDVSVSPTAHGFEDTVTLPAEPPGAVVRYEIALGGGVAGLRNVSGVVEMLDAHGTPAIRVAHAKVIGADARAQPVALTLRGCAFDDAPAPPWGRPVTAPQAEACVIEARLPDDVVYPARLDPTWTATDQMNEARYELSAVPLPSGRIFVIGGLGEGAEKAADIFDPGTSTWSLAPSANLAIGAIRFTLSALNDGRLLLAGGEWDIAGTTIVASALALDPVTLTWSSLPAMAEARSEHTATVMADGRVLVAGGYNSGGVLGTSEIFDPVSNTWAPTGTLQEARRTHQAVAFGTRVLVAGGIASGSSALNSSEVFDPSANGGVGAWGTLRTFQGTRYGLALAQLGESRAIVFGGRNGAGVYQSSIQIYDFAGALWSTASATTPAVMEGRAVRLADGGVLFTGGCGAEQNCGSPSALATYYDAETAMPTPAGDIGNARGLHAMNALNDGRILLMGGLGDNFYFDDARVFAGLLAGQPCDRSLECASTFCVDGLCCDEACDGLCEACTLDRTGVVDGTCAGIVVDTDPDGECADDGSPNCGQNGLCAARGSCALYDGPGCEPLACGEDAECDSGHCVDAICCDVACDGVCYACTAEKKGGGSDGTCGPIALGRDPDEDCPDGAATSCAALRLCDGFGACGGADELCSPFACDADGCRTACTGDPQCALGLVCVAGGCVDPAELCTNGSILLARDGSSRDCSPFRCTPEACIASCSSLDDCQPPYVCDGATSACILPPADSGGDDGCALVRPAPSASAALSTLLGLFALGAVRRRKARAV